MRNTFYDHLRVQAVTPIRNNAFHFHSASARSMSSGDSSRKPSPDKKPAAGLDVEASKAAGLLPMIDSRHNDLKPRDIPMSSGDDEGGAQDDSDDASSPSAGWVAAEAAQASSKKAKVVRKKKSARVKKPKDMPRRPLSAYNIFFREERERMLKECREKAKAALGGLNSGETLPEPKIGFENMAKTIGKRWKALSEQELARYKDLAMADMERYRCERDTYQ